MNRLKKSVFICLILFFSSFIFLNSQDLNEIVKTGNFKIIIETLDNYYDKEKILKEIFKNRDKYKKPDYEYFLRSLILRYGLPEIYVSFFKKDMIFENEYMIFLKYFKEKNDLEKYLEYILKFDDEKNIDYKKITAQFSFENINKLLYERLSNRSKLKLFVTARLLVQTGKDIYAKELVDFSQEDILKIFDSDILNLQEKIKIVKFFDAKKVNTKLFSEEIHLLSFYDLENDYSSLLEGTVYEKTYKSFRSVLKGEKTVLFEGDSLFYPLSLIFLRDDENFNLFMKGKKNTNNVYLNYLYFLRYLLNSDEKNLKTYLSKMLSSKVDMFVKINCVNLYILSKKIPDGQFFFYYFQNDSENLRPFILTVGRKTFLYYKMLLEEGKIEEAKKFKQESFEDFELISDILLFEIKKGIIEKEDVEKYLKKYGKTPLKGLLLEYL
ncbi:MAG: hypothetical protein ABIN05_03525 [candidate division WOR-3 bacterium]